MLGMNMPKRSNRADKEFAAEMIKHHQTAVEMSRWLLRNGNHPKMKVMARRIIEAQTREIAVLRAFVAREGRHDH